MKRRRQEIRRRALKLLAGELGLSVEAMERQAHRMARATKELGVATVKFKLERHGMKLTKAEELEIAMVHQTLTIAMGDLQRVAKALERSPNMLTLIKAENALTQAAHSLRISRPVALCKSCKRDPAEVVHCTMCHGRGWVCSDDLVR